VCPQRFIAPLAPHLAAAAEGRAIDPLLLASGVDYWVERSDIVIVEGAGGFMTPLSDRDYVADVAITLGLPLVVVAPNRLGVINQVLQTLIVATTLGGELPIAGVVLNDVGAMSGDASLDSNRGELEQRAVPPVLGHLGFQSLQFDPPVDWFSLAGELRPREDSVA
jgi:dethiobiotin synthetase